MDNERYICPHCALITAYARYEGMRAAPDDWLQRELFAQPFPGSDGLAGIIITLNGHPPPMALVILGDDLHVLSERARRPVTAQSGKLGADLRRTAQAFALHVLGADDDDDDGIIGDAERIAGQAWGDDDDAVPF